MKKEKYSITFVVARSDDNYSITASLCHGLSHLDGLQGGLTTRSSQEQLVLTHVLPHHLYHVELLLGPEVAELPVASVYEVAREWLLVQFLNVLLQFVPGNALVFIEWGHYGRKYATKVNLGTR